MDRGIAAPWDAATDSTGPLPKLMTLEQALLGHVWSWTRQEANPDLSFEIRFSEDGSVTQGNGKGEGWSGRWEKTDARTVTVRLPGTELRLVFDETFNTFSTTTTDHRTPVKGTRKRAVSLGSSTTANGVPTTPQVKPKLTLIDMLSDQAPNVTAWITAPLDIGVPPAIWQNMTFLKESLRDEATRDPWASRSAYALGVRVCDLLVSFLEERRQAENLAGGAAVVQQSSQLTEWRRDNLTWPMYFLERDERIERQRKAKGYVFMSGHKVLQWSLRGHEMRGTIDTVYGQCREALRQGTLECISTPTFAPSSAAPATALQQQLMAYTWSYNDLSATPNPWKELRFALDGTVTTAAGTSVRWAPSGPRDVTLRYGANEQRVIAFDSNFRFFVGRTGDGRIVANGGRQAAAIEEPWIAKARGCMSSDSIPRPAKSLISILSEHAIEATAWITAPLDTGVPGEIWQNMTFLKEALRDEEVLNPAASKPAYDLGIRICDLMVADLEERRHLEVLAGGAKVLNQSSRLTEWRRDHLTWPMYALERDERAEREQNAANAQVFMSGHKALQWGIRGREMRGAIETLYRQFREALRPVGTTN